MGRQMAKIASRKLRAVEGKKLYRCIAVTSVTAPDHEYSRSFGPGQIVDLEESIGGGLKLRGEVRPGTFEAVDSSVAPRTKGENDGDTNRP